EGGLAGSGFGSPVLDLNGTSQGVGNLDGGEFGNGGTIVNNGGGAVTLTIGNGNGGGGNYAGVIADNNNATAGTIALTKIGTGTLTLSGANTYSGITTVAGGTLQFAQEVSLYNNVTANWTANNIVVGGTLALNVGGAGEFTASDVTALLGLGTATGGFKSGSTIGFDTTNAVGGNFTYNAVIANPNGGTNVLGLTKLGTGTLTLSGANTYTGGTTVSKSTLQLSGAGTLGSTGGALT